MTGILFRRLVVLMVLGCAGVASGKQAESESNEFGRVQISFSAQGKPLKDVFVWLVDVDKKNRRLVSDDEQSRPKVITAEEKGFSPCCLVVQRGEITFAASKFLEHGIDVCYSDQTWSMNIQPAGEVTIEILESNKIPGRIFGGTDDYSESNLLVLDHAFGTVSNSDGFAEITDVPQGSFTLRIWHPDYKFPESIQSGSKTTELDRGKYRIVFDQKKRNYELEVSWPNASHEE